LLDFIVNKPKNSNKFKKQSILKYRDINYLIKSKNYYDKNRMPKVKFNSNNKKLSDLLLKPINLKELQQSKQKSFEPLSLLKPSLLNRNKCYSKNYWRFSLPNN